MKGKKVRTIFIAFLILLPIQYGLVGIIGELHSEPWPAFVFPGFKNVCVSDDGLFQIEQILFQLHLEGEERVVDLRPQELFSEIPLSQVPGFMRMHFKDTERLRKLSTPARSWLYKQVTEKTGYIPIRVDLVRRIEFYDQVYNRTVQHSVREMERVPIEMGPEEE